MKSKNSDIPLSILSNEKCITESTAIANIYNDFSYPVAIQSKINFSCKSSTDHLPSKSFLYNFYI